MRAVNVYDWGGRRQAEEAGVVVVMRGTPLTLIRGSAGEVNAALTRK